MLILSANEYNHFKVEFKSNQVELNSKSLNSGKEKKGYTRSILYRSWNMSVSVARECLASSSMQKMLPGSWLCPRASNKNSYRRSSLVSTLLYLILQERNWVWCWKAGDKCFPGSRNADYSMTFPWMKIRMLPGSRGNDGSRFAVCGAVSFLDILLFPANARSSPQIGIDIRHRFNIAIG